MQFSHFEIQESSWNNILRIRLSGKLTVEDYEVCIPELDRMIADHGKVRIFLELIDFHGWTTAAAWEDAKFGIHHYADIERIAILGNKAWEKGMAIIVKPFTKAKVRYFDVDDKDHAMHWVAADEG